MTGATKGERRRLYLFTECQPNNQLGCFVTVTPFIFYNKMLFAASVQPSIISLFSSTSSEPLTLFRTSVDKSLPSDSFLHFLHDQYSNPPPPPPGSLLHLPNISEQDNSPNYGYELDQTVLHIQSPTIQTTYIHSPKAESRDRSNTLGVKHPWMHLQVRNLGREWSFEVGIVDHAGRAGVVRLSTFQVNFFFPCNFFPQHLCSFFLSFTSLNQ